MGDIAEVGKYEWQANTVTAIMNAILSENLDDAMMLLADFNSMADPQVAERSGVTVSYAFLAKLLQALIEKGLRG